jgi:hypothetical protein
LPIGGFPDDRKILVGAEAQPSAVKRDVLSYAEIDGFRPFFDFLAHLRKVGRRLFNPTGTTANLLPAGKMAARGTRSLAIELRLSSDNPAWGYPAIVLPAEQFPRITPCLYRRENFRLKTKVIA